LQREGGKYPDSWHYNHMDDPRTMSPGSIMPMYPWLLDDELDTSSTAPKIRAMMTLGVPYPEGYDKIANQDLVRQQNKIVNNLKESGIEALPNKEIIAMISYLQRLGTDIKGENKIVFGQIATTKP
jgi:cytochrome c oxidase cbb3-type subunit I/II